MEIPYAGRAIITDLYNGAEITILPFRQAIFCLHAVVFLAFFGLFSYFIFIFIFIDKTARPASDKQVTYFVFAMYGIILFGLLSAGYAIWWMIMGKEVVTIADGVLTINKVNALEKTKSYDLSLATNFRAEEEVVRRGRNFGRVEGYAWQVAVKGTIKFDYDVVDTIQFGDWLSEAEGNYILERLRSKKLISDA